MNNSKQVHMFIGPRIFDNMTIGELNGARWLAKYSINKTFPSINSFNKYCSQFTSEQELLKTIYKGYNVEALCGEDLTTYLCIKAHDDNNNKIPIKYKKTKELSEAQKEKIRKELLMKEPTFKRLARERELKRRQNER